MAFNIKTWINRITQYPGRRLMRPTGTTNEYDVERSEGVVTTEGDILNANTFNDLETRIADAFDEVDNNFGGAKFSVENNNVYVIYVDDNQQTIKKRLGSLDPATLTATPEDVLSGKTFGGYGVDDPQTGTMINKSGVTTTSNEVSQVDNSIRMKVPTNAYYSTTSYLDTPTSTFGNATAEQVLSGRTFSSSAGLAQVGTMVNNGDHSTASSVGVDSVGLYAYFPSGYYSAHSNNNAYVYLDTAMVNHAASARLASQDYGGSGSFTASGPGVIIVGAYMTKGYSVRIYSGGSQKAIATASGSNQWVWTSYKFKKGEAISFDSASSGNARNLQAFRVYF